MLIEMHDREAFNRYALAHAYLLALAKGNLADPLIKQLANNLKKGPTGAFSFVREGLNDRISQLASAFKALEAILSAA